MRELVYSRLLAAAVERHASRVMVSDGDHSATWAEHWERTVALATALRDELRIGRSDRFAVLSLNSHRYVELYGAAFLGAGMINPLNTRLSAAEIEYILADSGTNLVFVDGPCASLLGEGVVERLNLRLVHLSDRADGGNDYEDLLQTVARPQLPADPDEDDAVVLMYTGGTTGLPKGVVHTQRAQALNLYHLQIGYPFDDSSVMLLVVPLFHAGGLSGSLLAPVMGAPLVVQPGFDPQRVVEAVDAHQVTHMGAVPTMLGMLLRSDAFEPHRLRSLRRVLCGGSPLPLSLIEEIEAALPELRIIQGYGMTEAGLLVSALSASQRDGENRLRSVGQPVLGVDVQIQGPDGAPLERGCTGEICIRGGNLMSHYWNQPAATADAMRGGWYHSGDAGYFDDDGYLFIADRVKDMIITGGENVYPAEVENVIAGHPAVAQVAVIGVPHEIWGEAVHAVVVPRPGIDVTVEEIILYARERIAGYKAPKSVEFRDALPLSGFMKPLKRELREDYRKRLDAAPAATKAGASR